MARKLVLGCLEECSDVRAFPALALPARQAALRLATLASARTASQGEQLSEAVVSETEIVASN